MGISLSKKKQEKDSQIPSNNNSENELNTQNKIMSELIHQNFIIREKSFSPKNSEKTKSLYEAAKQKRETREKIENLMSLSELNSILHLKTPKGAHALIYKKLFKYFIPIK